MTRGPMPAATVLETIATVFGRLFENEFATLDDIAISCRSDAGISHVEGTAALRLWLADGASASPPEPADPATARLHEALHEALPDHDTVISGTSRHLQALLLEGFPPPPSTSMLRARGIPDIGAHVVAPKALAPPALAATIEQARVLAERMDMRHLLVVTSTGRVIVSGAPPFETMAHWHNIEFAARVECLRLEEAARGRA